MVIVHRANIVSVVVMSVLVQKRVTPDVTFFFLTEAAVLCRHQLQLWYDHIAVIRCKGMGKTVTKASLYF